MWSWAFYTYYLYTCFTFTGAVGSSQHSTLVYAAKGLKQPSDILIALLLSQHAYKQLSVLWETKNMWMKGKKKIQNQTLILSLSDNTIEALLEIYPSLEATMSTREQYWLQRVVTSEGSGKSVSWIYVCKAWDQVSHQTTQWLISISIWSTFKPHWNVRVCVCLTVSHLLCPHCQLVSPGLADSSEEQTRRNINTNGLFAFVSA